MGGSGSIEKLKYVSPPAAEYSKYEEKEGPFWKVDVDAELSTKFAERGVASLPPTTVMAVFKEAVYRMGDKPAFKAEVNNQWKTWSFNQYYEEVTCAARALIHLGMKPYESVNVIGFNSPEWFISTIAAIAAGGKCAGIYTTNASAACRYITEHSEARVVVVENKQQLDKFLPWRDECRNLSAIVMWSGEVPAGVNDNTRVPVYTWNEFMDFGRKENRDALNAEMDRRIQMQRPGHCCTLIYTSGTTGNPKAVMLSHDNVTWTPTAFLELLPPMNVDNEERMVSYLPLSHIAAQMLDIFTPLQLGRKGVGAVIYFARPDALKGSLGTTLKQAHPTVFFGVPRVWEKMMEKMLSIGSQTTGLKKSIATWAKSKGAEKSRAEQVSEDGSVPWGFTLADSLIFSKIRAALGLDSCRMCLTGAAPISKEVLNYFAQFDINVCEVYGMSESSGPQNTCRYNYKKFGSCGVPIAGTEVKIDHVQGRDKEGEGEVCFRGRHIMMGYMKDPEKTREAIDPIGFLHSGDVGRIDENGLLYITGRIKELIITAGGENVAPVPVEDAIKAELPAVSNVMMIGDRRKFNSCLITLKEEMDEKSGDFTGNLSGAALQVSAESKTVQQAMNDPVWKKYIQDGIDRANKQAVSNAQKIQKFTILPRDFSVPSGELTATLKLRRSVVSEMYAREIEALYADDKE